MRLASHALRRLSWWNDVGCGSRVPNSFHCVDDIWLSPVFSRFMHHSAGDNLFYSCSIQLRCHAGGIRQRAPQTFEGPSWCEPRSRPAMVSWHTQSGARCRAGAPRSCTFSRHVQALALLGTGTAGSMVHLKQLWDIDNLVFIGSLHEDWSSRLAVALCRGTSVLSWLKELVVDQGPMNIRHSP